jgi:hypothetical protein
MVQTGYTPGAVNLRDMPGFLFGGGSNGWPAALLVAPIPMQQECQSSQGYVPHLEAALCEQPHLRQVNE